MAAGFAGVNVTIPHKVAAFAMCDAVDERAIRAGAVNTLVFRDGRIRGTNTDGFGFLSDLRDHEIDPQAGPSLIIGAGGAARAIAASLLELGVRVTIANRSPTRAAALASDLPGLQVIEWDQRSEALVDQALLVNTTPLGMAGYRDLEIDLDRAYQALTVVDVVYVPLQTRFLREARERGMRAVNGLGMLLHQARPGFAYWFGVDPTVDQELREFIAADVPPT
jgi:shikimate dehydrogenase